MKTRTAHQVGMIRILARAVWAAEQAYQDCSAADGDESAPEYQRVVAAQTRLARYEQSVNEEERAAVDGTGCPGCTATPQRREGRPSCSDPWHAAA